MRPALIASMVARQTSASPNLLTPSDFTYLGSTQLPHSTLPDGKFDYSTGVMTGRRVGGEIHLFLMGSGVGSGVNNDNDQAVELKYNGVGIANPMTLVTNWGDPTKNTMVSLNAYYVQVRGLLWDPVLSVLMWCYGDTYNTGGNNDPSTGYSTLTGSSNAGVTAYGPWRMLSHSKKVEGYMFHLPPVVQTALGSGMRVGSGAPRAAGDAVAAWGSYLGAWAPPSSGTAADTTGNSAHAITDQPLIYCDFTTPQVKPAGSATQCQWDHYGTHDVLVTLSAGNSNLLSTSGAGAYIVQSASAAFTSGMVGNNLYLSGGTNFDAGVYYISSYIDSTHLQLQGFPSPSPTPAAAGSGGAGEIGAEPQLNPVQDGTGRNINGNLGGVSTSPSAAVFGGGDAISGRVGQDNAMCAVWINGGSKQGLVYLSQILAAIPGEVYAGDGLPHTWYGPAQVYPTGKYCAHGHNSAWSGPSTGPGSDIVGNVMYIYDPADILAVIAGSKTALSITQNFAATDAYPMTSLAHGSSVQVVGGADVNGAAYPALSNGHVSGPGVWFDDVSQLMFVSEINRDQNGSVYQPVVHVFSVNC